MGHGDKHCIVSTVERKTDYLLIGKMTARTAQQLSQRTFALMAQHPLSFETITADNGTEFHDYEVIEIRRKCAELQNAALERYGHAARVDHRTLRDTALLARPSVT